MTADYASLPLVDPAGESGLLAVGRKQYLLRLLVRRELTARYSGSFLGLLWSYFNPLTQLFIYWFVMGKIMGMAGKTEQFAIHVFVGLIAVHFFTETFNAGTRSIMRNKAFVKKMALPLEMFPVSTVLVSLLNAGPALLLLVVICLFNGWQPDLVGVAAFALATLIMVTVGTGVALMLSVANVLWRDTGQLVGILTNFIRFSVPMMYPFTRVTGSIPDYLEYYLANPIADVVLLLQRAFWVGTTSDPGRISESHFPDNLMTHGLIALAAGVVLLVIGQVVFSRLERRVPERV
ncbi:ABC transporter permease [Nocardioides sp.]|uniref:ABC transporter permease n=1 Tax=Nocardioides sp. TaxID=35761 RepID=UPI002C45CC64|nr:ABC transporter permease [Nocardioides sp.]HSX66295.1 ABC transporter permease [Nocardioides sp.]